MVQTTSDLYCESLMSPIGPGMPDERRDVTIRPERRRFLRECGLSPTSAGGPVRFRHCARHSRLSKTTIQTSGWKWRI